MTGATRPALVWRNASFRRVWLGQVASQAGSRMCQIALVWWLVKSTAEGESGTYVGAFMLLSALPSILLFKPIGRLLERTSSKLVLVYAALAAALVIAALGGVLHFGLLTPVLACVFGFLTATCQSFVDPTLPKSVPELVLPEEVEEAVAYETSTQSLANAGGAVFGAMLVGAVGFPGAIGLNVLGYAFAALMTSRATFTPTVAEAPRAEPEGAAAKAADAAARSSGLGLLKDLPLVRKLLYSAAAINFFAAPTFVILPLYVNNILKSDATTLGALEGALWLGLLAGAFASRLVPARFGVVDVVAAMLTMFAASLVIPGVVHVSYAYGVALALAGVAVGVSNVKLVALFQKLVPDERKGRFFALMQAMISASFPLAMLVFGVAGDHVPAWSLCLAQAAGVFAIVPWLLLLRRLEPHRSP